MNKLTVSGCFWNSIPIHFLNPMLYVLGWVWGFAKLNKNQLQNELSKYKLWAGSTQLTMLLISISSFSQVERLDHNSQLDMSQIFKHQNLGAIQIQIPYVTNTSSFSTFFFIRLGKKWANKFKSRISHHHWFATTVSSNITYACLLLDDQHTHCTTLKLWRSFLIDRYSYLYLS